MDKIKREDRGAPPPQQPDAGDHIQSDPVAKVRKGRPNPLHAKVQPIIFVVRTIYSIYFKQHPKNATGFALVCLSAIGVVFGDIGMY